MLTWKGSGIVVPAVTFGCVLAMEVVTEVIAGDDRYYQENTWPMATGFVLAAFIVRLLAAREAASPRMLIDEKTGERVVVEEERHSFLWIPLRYWPPILALVGGAIQVHAWIS